MRNKHAIQTGQTSIFNLWGANRKKLPAPEDFMPAPLFEKKKNILTMPAPLRCFVCHLGKSTTCQWWAGRPSATHEKSGWILCWKKNMLPETKQFAPGERQKIQIHQLLSLIFRAKLLLVSWKVVWRKIWHDANPPGQFGSLIELLNRKHNLLKWYHGIPMNSLWPYGKSSGCNKNN